MYFQEIDEIRDQLDVTALELCRLAKVHPGQYSKYRQGTNRPGESVLRRLTAAIKVLRVTKSEAKPCGR